MTYIPVEDFIARQAHREQDRRLARLKLDRDLAEAKRLSAEEQAEQQEKVTEQNDWTERQGQNVQCETDS